MSIIKELLEGKAGEDNGSRIKRLLMFIVPLLIVALVAIKLIKVVPVQTDGEYLKDQREDDTDAVALLNARVTELEGIVAGFEPAGMTKKQIRDEMAYFIKCHEGGFGRKGLNADSNCRPYHIGGK